MKTTQVEKAIEKLLKKHNVGMSFNFKFPGFDRPPLVARVAFWLLNRTNFMLNIDIVPLNKK